jgi:hypothetical protein
VVDFNQLIKLNVIRSVTIFGKTEIAGSRVERFTALRVHTGDSFPVHIANHFSGYLLLVVVLRIPSAIMASCEQVGHPGFRRGLARPQVNLVKACCCTVTAKDQLCEYHVAGRRAD